MESVGGFIFSVTVISVVTGAIEKLCSGTGLSRYLNLITSLILVSALLSPAASFISRVRTSSLSLFSDPEEKIHNIVNPQNPDGLYGQYFDTYKKSLEDMTEEALAEMCAGHLKISRQQLDGYMTFDACFSEKKDEGADPGSLEFTSAVITVNAAGTEKFGNCVLEGLNEYICAASEGKAEVVW